MSVACGVGVRRWISVVATLAIGVTSAWPAHADGPTAPAAPPAPPPADTAKPDEPPPSSVSVPRGASGAVIVPPKDEPAPPPPAAPVITPPKITKDEGAQYPAQALKDGVKEAVSVVVVL